MNRLHLLDTNVYRYWIDGRHERHSDAVCAVESWGDQYVFLSAITVAEVEFGLSLPHRLDLDLAQKIRRGLSMFPVLEISRYVAEPYGAMRSWLVQRFAPVRQRRLRSLSQLADPVTDLALGIQENDLWLASQALANDAVLVTVDRMTHIREAALATGMELHVSDVDPAESDEPAENGQPVENDQPDSSGG